MKAKCPEINRSLLSKIIIFIIFIITFLCLTCVSTQNKTSTFSTPKSDQTKSFDDFLFEQSGTRLSSDSRFQRILELHTRIISNRIKAEQAINEIKYINEELLQLITECPQPKTSAPYSVSSIITEPSNLSYSHKSIYACEHYLNDSETAMANSQNHLEYLEQIQREMEHRLIQIQRECETRGIAGEYQYLLLQSLDHYLNLALGQNKLFFQWQKDVEMFAMNYASCMEDSEFQ